MSRVYINHRYHINSFKVSITFNIFRLSFTFNKLKLKLIFQTNDNRLIIYCSSGNEKSRCKEMSPSNKHFVTWYQKFKEVSKVPDDVHAATLDDLYHKVRISLFHSANHVISRHLMEKDITTAKVVTLYLK